MVVFKNVLCLRCSCKWRKCSQTIACMSVHEICFISLSSTPLLLFIMLNSTQECVCERERQRQRQREARNANRKSCGSRSPPLQYFLFMFHTHVKDGSLMLWYRYWDHIYHARFALLSDFKASICSTHNIGDILGISLNRQQRSPHNTMLCECTLCQRSTY
jgi:hypothetical protein